MNAKELGAQSAAPTVETSPALRAGVPDVHSTGGLTKREHFAGLMMQAILSRSTFNPHEASKAPYVAVAYADALLEELARKTP